jgi:hypothetical protein
MIISSGTKHFPIRPIAYLPEYCVSVQFCRKAIPSWASRKESDTAAVGKGQFVVCARY